MSGARLDLAGKKGDQVVPAGDLSFNWRRFIIKEAEIEDGSFSEPSYEAKSENRKGADNSPPRRPRTQGPERWFKAPVRSSGENFKSYEGRKKSQSWNGYSLK